MIELKPCPFCGYEFPNIDGVGRSQLFYVVCSLCHSTGPVCSSPEIAAMQWNHADKRKEKEND